MKPTFMIWVLKVQNLEKEKIAKHEKTWLAKCHQCQTIGQSLAAQFFFEI